MDKKLLKIVGTVALSGVVLCGSAYAAIAGTSGYDLYKQAFENTYALHSLTPQTQITVKDNEHVLFTVNNLSKLDKDQRSMSSSTEITAGKLSEKMEVYRQDNQTIMKNSDSPVYNVMQANQRWRDPDKKAPKDDSARIKEMEPIADALAGNVQNYITVTDQADGTKEVSLELAENQVSPVVNAAASVMVQNLERANEHWGNRGPEANRPELEADLIKQLKGQLPQLVDNIRVSAVSVDANITKDNLIQNQTENFTISGRDAQGQSHEVVVAVQTNLSGFNNTVPDKVDLKGKQVNEIQFAGRHHER